MERYEVLRLTNLCNYKCKFCNVWQELKIGKKKHVLSYEDFKKNIESKKNKFISLSGGEPLIVIDKYIDLLKNYIGRGYIFDIQTTGFLLTTDVIMKLYEAGIKKFFVSFHIHIEDIYNFLVGGKFWKKVFNNLKDIDTLIEKENLDIEIILNPVFNRLTYKYLDDYFNFLYLQFKNIREVSLSFIQPRGLAEKNNDLLLRKQDYSNLEKKTKFLDKWFDKGFKINNPFCGLPICCLGRYKYTLYCTDIVENYSSLIKNIELNLQETYYDTKCYKCKWQYLCKGYWK